MADQRWSDGPEFANVPTAQAQSAEIALLVPNVVNGRISLDTVINFIDAGITRVRNGNGPPANSFGNDGDFYFDNASTPTSCDFYGPKASGAWPASVSLKGPQGNDGDDGREITSITAVPGTAPGTINVTFNFDSGPSSTITTPNLTGPAGDDGNDGNDGREITSITSASSTTFGAFDLTFNFDNGPSSTITTPNLSLSSQRVVAETNVTAVRTANTFADFLSVTVPASLGAGTYDIEVYYMWALDSTTSDFESQITLNGAAIDDLHKQEPKDSAGANVDGSGTDQAHVAYRRKINRSLTTGDVIALTWRPNTAGVEATIREGSITVTRVA